MTFLKKFGKAAGRGGRKKKISGVGSLGELTIPTNFICPITLDLMKDPVTLSTGITYDRESIERWLEAGSKTCPVTNQGLTTARDLIPNHAIRKMIQGWCVENKSHGVERIPTPRIPVSPSQVSEVCARMEGAAERGDDAKCAELLERIKVWGKESERNKKCLRENGAGGALAACFEFFAGVPGAKHADLLKDLLSVLTWMFPVVGEEGRSKLGSKTSLRCMAWFLNGEDLSATQNALIVLKELLHLDQNYANALLETNQEIPQALFNAVKVPICPSDKTTTKASLTVMYHMITSQPNGKKVISKLLDAGLVSVLLEILVDADKNVCQTALAVLDGVCSSQEGREKACSHPLTMPLLVKKIMRVSEVGTELCISAIWKLCKGEDERAAIEALELGAFQKLLVVLQVGCGEKAKERATELLKLMNLYKDRVECLDSSTGFKYLKRSY
ncbi:PREDICTED: U-box domain-containing protein 21-like [Ipomoea nil]|uniref:U-box domain-containing protein 21-like n=1 Tax=Ipomoea nil TaxID=35883 RepID=UPI000901D0EC|nr:PREDICTED: U-box domain-containing protein 21-like [Ipomoea nil]